MAYKCNHLFAVVPGFKRIPDSHISAHRNCAHVHDARSAGENVTSDVDIAPNEPEGPEP